MASVRQRSGKYEVRAQYNGKVYSKTFRSRAEAQQCDLAAKSIFFMNERQKTVEGVVVLGTRRVKLVEGSQLTGC